MGPARRLGMLTGAAVLALIVAALLGDSGSASRRAPGSVTPAEFEANGEGGCPVGAREVVLRGLGRPIKVRLDAAAGRDRSLARRPAPTGGSVRDRWELVFRDPCFRPPCPSPEDGSNFFARRFCADR